MTIRMATQKDFDSLTKLFREFYSRFNLEQTVTGPVKELLQVHDVTSFVHDTIASYFAEDYFVLVAEVNEEVVGFLSAKFDRSPHYVYSPDAEVIDWFVTEQLRQQGIGKKLYQTFIEECQKRGIKSLTVEAFYENKATIDTYTRLGFTPDSLILKKIL